MRWGCLVAALMIAHVAIAEPAVGTYNGFVGNVVDGEYIANGTISFTVADTGKLTAKVTTAVSSVSLRANDWDAVSNGVYTLKRVIRKGVGLSISLDANAAWDARQLGGTFTSGGNEFTIAAQRNPFVTTWHFTATGNAGNGWVLDYAPDAKSADLKLSIKSDGSAALAGKLDGFKVSASGAVDISNLKNGALLADFVPTVAVKTDRSTVKRPAWIRTNLWFDRSVSHAEGVGSVKFVD